jgi:hypothetical protein
MLVIQRDAERTARWLDFVSFNYLTNLPFKQMKFELSYWLIDLPRWKQLYYQLNCFWSEGTSDYLSDAFK